MKRSFTYALGGHLLILLLLWLSGQTFYKPTRIQGYPTKINARVVEKNAIQQRSQRPPSPPKQEAAKPKVQPETKKSAPAPKKQAPKPRAKPQKQQSAPAAPAAAPAANSLSLDAQDFPFPEYLLLMQYRVERQWNPPRADLGGRSALIFFRLERNGKVAEAKVERSSGNFAFDQAALRAVYSADPLPALPEESTLNTLGVHFEFVGN